MALQGEVVLLQEVEDRHLALVLDFDIVAAERVLIEGHLDEPRAFRPCLLFCLVAHV